MPFHQNPFDNNEKIIFPVNYDLKIIMLANNRHADNRAIIEQVFVQLGISFLNWQRKIYQLYGSYSLA